VALPPNDEARYHDKPILPDYDLVDVAWMNNDFDEDELDIPIEEGARFIGAALGMRVLWNKADIVLEMPMPASQPSQLSLSPPGGPSDDDDDGGNDNGGNDNGNASGPSNTPLGSPSPSNNNPQVRHRGRTGQCDTNTYKWFEVGLKPMSSPTEEAYR
jgi:hypothetical protein